MRPIQITFSKLEYDFIMYESGLKKVGEDMRLVKDDVVDITFNLRRIDHDVPHTPEPIDLTNKVITFEAVQIGPVPDDKELETPKTITIVGVNQVPLADGVVVVIFDAADTDTAGAYRCRLIIDDMVLGTRESSRYPFSLDIDN